MRPRRLAEVVGQEHITREGSLLPRLVAQDRFGSLIFYGPPGCGKTSLAESIAAESGGRFVRINAVMSNVAELRQILAAARANPAARTILFIDELHRFNKSQQDLLLPDVEEGHVRLIGATTHNPGFYVNPPLLSRSHLFRLEPLSPAAIAGVMQRALADTERGLGSRRCSAEEKLLLDLGALCEGDLRRALNALEVIVLGLDVSKFSRASGVSVTTPTRTSTTTPFRPSSKAVVAVTPMRRCIGWRRCWRAAKTRASWRGDS